MEIRQRNDGADSPHAVELRDRLHEPGEVASGEFDCTRLGLALL
jgi:hypothetical protein